MYRTLSIACVFLSVTLVSVQATPLSLEKVKAKGAKNSAYRTQKELIFNSETPAPNLEEFRQDIEPALKESCFKCHGEKKQKAAFRVDTLDPDLLHGPDVDWWIEVVEVLSNGEMPPEDEEPMPEKVRVKVIDWLSNEIHIASQVRRSQEGHSSFRRMTRYEYNYVLQDLLGLPYDFAKDLPPETYSEDGFENSSEMLQISVTQFETYRELSRKALEKATVRGERPEMLYYSIPMTTAAAKMRARKDLDLEKASKNSEGDPEKLKQAIENITKRYALKEDKTHFIDLKTGEGITSVFNYRDGKLSHFPSTIKHQTPPVSPLVLIIPGGEEQKIDLSDQLPDSGILRIRLRASRVSKKNPSPPALRLKFGYQPSNDSRTSVPVSDRNVTILASPKKPQFYQWDIPLKEIPRNTYRGVTQLGDLPNPSEYLIFENIYSGQGSGLRTGIQIDYLEIATPHYEQWPRESHRRIFIKSDQESNESAYAKEILANFMPRAWRRAVKDTEIDQKLKLFKNLRPLCEDFQEAVIEVLAAVLASPKFLYLVQEDLETEGVDLLTDYELATRLSMFLWCSTPDDELLELAAKGKLNQSRVLAEQTRRMLTDSRSQRFSKHFVRQWLGMQLLDFLDVEEEVYPEFDNDLKEAMQQEPIALFEEVLKKNRSVLNFLHADYTLTNERLARHYGITNVFGSDFRKVKLSPVHRRGGLMTQAGLLAMNSDGRDSHPLKRGIWILERLLNDPPPQPPAAVPEIDLTDPEIAKLTLKQRIENHRDDPACMSCHAKIDPWGIAFENFDAVGSWRDEINQIPVDANSRLFNNQKLNGIDGLKRFLLTNRQDQFCRAMVYKLTTYALGRPLSFSDRAGIEEITLKFRNKKDRLGDLISLIVTSDLFRTK
ncbi:MAG: hypothetical protein CMI18_07485 [Opitutaceae bacterium]|nr:hypothetical protein [Opitutaceae bacterium]